VKYLAIPPSGIISACPYTSTPIEISNITLPGYLLNRIDEYVLNHPQEKSRSGFLASAALKVLQQER